MGVNLTTDPFPENCTEWPNGRKITRDPWPTRTTWDATTGVSLGDAELDGLTDADGEIDGDSDSDGETDGLAELDGETDSDGERLGLSELDGD